MITLVEAKEIVKNGLLNILQLQANDITPEQVADFNVHLELTASVAKIIADKTPNLDGEKAYIYGLLHDCGKFHGDMFGKNSFHGLVGYQKMQEQGLFDIAKISLTHSFFNQDFRIEEYGYDYDSLVKTKEIFKTIELDDYDKLLALSDILNNSKKFCYGKIEDRMERVRKKYNMSDEVFKKTCQEAMAVKQYFDQLCNCDVYDLLGLNDEQ